MADLYLAVVSKSQSVQDFQVLVPLLLTLFIDPDINIRRLAVECLRKVEITYSSYTPKKISEFFGAKNFYGSGSIQLQFLETACAKGFIKSLLGATHGILADPEFLIDRISTIIDSVKVDKNKRASKDIIIFSMSHILAYNSPHFRYLLLKVFIRSLINLNFLNQIPILTL